MNYRVKSAQSLVTGCSSSHGKLFAGLCGVVQVRRPVPVTSIVIWILSGKICSAEFSKLNWMLRLGLGKRCYGRLRG